MLLSICMLAGFLSYCWRGTHRYCPCQTSRRPWSCWTMHMSQRTWLSAQWVGVPKFTIPLPRNITVEKDLCGSSLQLCRGLVHVFQDCESVACTALCKETFIALCRLEVFSVSKHIILYVRTFQIPSVRPENPTIADPWRSRQIYQNISMTWIIRSQLQSRL